MKGPFKPEDFVTLFPTYGYMETVDHDTAQIQERENAARVANSHPFVKEAMELEEKLRVAVEALKFYANELEWLDFKEYCEGFKGVERLESHFDGDNGERAREALAKIKGGGE